MTPAGHPKPFIAPGCNVVANLPVSADPADIRHENPRLARNVSAHVPGVGLERAARDLVLGAFRSFNNSKVSLAHIAYAVADPVNMLFDRHNHIA